ncbi:hypothetical protein [Ferroplasma sp.]
MRPALILAKHEQTSLLLVVPFTSTLGLADFPIHVKLNDQTTTD